MENTSKTVRELVKDFEGWGKESGTLERIDEPFKFGQEHLHSQDGLEGSPLKKRRLAMIASPIRS